MMARGAALWATGWLAMAALFGTRQKHAAFDAREPAADPEQGPVPVRSAGPDAMRDGDHMGWDKVDQAVDESFPASDPPSR
jgi:hypothetical protein